MLPQIVLRLRRQLGNGLEQRVGPSVLRNRAERALSPNIHAKLVRKLIAQLPERVHVLVQVSAHGVAEVDLVVPVLHPELADRLFVTPLLPCPSSLTRVELLIVSSLKQSYTAPVPPT